jgi:multisubunit Na+/H+ antiporter MnhG subunit
MKTFIGYALIILGIVTFFRLPDFGRNIPESVGYLIGLAIIIVPGILLVKSGQKKTEDKK